MISTTIVRFKYYHAWLLADAICNNSGLGFNGYESDGNAKWDMITNINVISFEVMHVHQWCEEGITEFGDKSNFCLFLPFL